jgi:hypothetical protein
MKRTLFITGLFLLALTVGGQPALAGGPGAEPAGFGDMIANFFNFSWLRDADGDGIPNGIDDDYVPPEDGTGYQDKHRNSLTTDGPGPGFNGSTFGPQAMLQYRLGYQYQSMSGDLVRLRLQLHDQSCLK